VYPLLMPLENKRINLRQKPLNPQKPAINARRRVFMC
jgi:hypothetical protein